MKNEFWKQALGWCKTDGKTEKAEAKRKYPVKTIIFAQKSAFGLRAACMRTKSMLNLPKSGLRKCFTWNERKLSEDADFCAQTANVSIHLRANSYWLTAEKGDIFFLQKHIFRKYRLLTFANNKKQFLQSKTQPHAETQGKMLFVRSTQSKTSYFFRAWFWQRSSFFPRLSVKSVVFFVVSTCISSFLSKNIKTYRLEAENPEFRNIKSSKNVKFQQKFHKGTKNSRKKG